MTDDPSRRDVVAVVGAGFAGLTAATRLQEAGVDVVVLDARPRVGGKVESEPDALGRRVDTGGQFVCDDMPAVLALIARFGGRLVAVDHDRGGLGWVGGGGFTVDPDAVWAAFEDAEVAFAAMSHLPDPPAGDRLSLADWFAAQGLDPIVHLAAHSVFNGVMCTEIADLPLAHVIDLVRRTPLTGEELQYVVADTMHAVAEDLAATLHHPPLLGNPVRAVEVGEHTVSVITDDGTVAADHVVLAVPPSALAGITIDPPLPQRVQAAAAAFRPGSVMKFMLRYERAFWSDANVGPTRAWLEPRGLYVGDASIDDVPMLVGFLGGPATAEWRSLGAAARRRALLDHLVEAYGAEAGHPTSFVERDWCPDEWGGGGYWNVLLDHAQHDAVEVLRGGAPGITFASTELAPSFPGYVEGAITAGRDAAERVLRSLGRVCQSDEP